MSHRVPPVDLLLIGTTDEGDKGWFLIPPLTSAEIAFLTFCVSLGALLGLLLAAYR